MHIYIVDELIYLFIHMSLVLYIYILSTHASCTILFHGVGSFRLNAIYVISCLNTYIVILV